MVGIPSPEASQFEPYLKIIKRDRTRGRAKAAKELAFIYYMWHWESPYAAYEESLREEKIIEDIFPDEDWTPDDRVLDACRLYREQTENEYIRLLQAARTAANKLIDYFETTDLNERDERDRPIHTAKDMINNISKVGEVVEGIDKLKEIIEKNQSKNSSNRAGVETNKYSE